jgi:alpha-D-ribose 1-methylphosphonate 5-triphosphate diphosphatase
MAPRRVILRGGDIVTPSRVLTGGALVVEGERIAALLQAVPPLAGEDVLWVSGLLAPAFIDLHSDALEKEIRPRPGATIPAELAIMEFDRKLAGHGITSVVHGLCFTETDGDFRAFAESARIAAAVRRHAPACLVRHLLHARYEITDVGAAPTVERLVRDGMLTMVSFMDHAPGGRQFKSGSDFVRYYAPTLGQHPEVVLRLAEEKQRRKREERARLDAEAARLADAARRRGVILASHDDGSAADVAWAAGLGVTLSEFPVSMEALVAARERGLHVVMGAPNVLRGGSTTGNLSALEALRRGGVDSICSDYYPASLLHAAAKLYATGYATLPEALALVTLHPAQALGMAGELGSLEPGKLADLVVIGERGGVPVVTRTLRAGAEVFVAGYREAAPACVPA